MHTMARIKQSLQKAGLLTFAFLAAFVIFMGMAVVIAAWTDPEENPPAGNVPEPVNVGQYYQEKDGDIGAYDFYMKGYPYTEGYPPGGFVGSRVVGLETGWRLLAKGVDHTEEALFEFTSSTHTGKYDYTVANQQSYLGAISWPADPAAVSELLFVVKRNGNTEPFCAGPGPATQLNLSGGTGIFPACTRVYRRGISVTTSTVTSQNWMRLAVNGIGMFSCPDALGIEKFESRYVPPAASGEYGTFCHYKKSIGSWFGELEKVQVEEADWSIGYGSWTWEIWYRYYDETQPNPTGPTASPVNPRCGGGCPVGTRCWGAAPGEPYQCVPWPPEK